MSAVPAQAGTAVEVGFQGYSWSGYLPEDGFQVVKAFAETEELTDLNGATRTKVRTNPYTEWSGALVVDSGSSFLFTEGDTIALTVPTDDGSGVAVVAEVQSGTAVQLNRKSLRVNITIRKEDSMTYTTSA